TLSDGFGGNSTATVAIDVTNRNPIAKADTYTIRPNQTLNVAAPGLLGNDSDPDGDALNVSVLNVTGLKGTITPYADGHFSFTPTTNFAGTTSFTYTISDGVGGRSTATATINVVNSAPVAGNDHYAVHAGRTLDISAPGLLANDRDADGDALSVAVVNVSGLRGTLTPYADGHFSFTPTAGFVGTTSFSYTLSDGFGGNSTATVAIDVTNRAPVASDDRYAVETGKTLEIAAPGLLANDHDGDGDALSVSQLNVTGLKGTITPYTDGHFRFVPTAGFTGTTSFSYKVSDGLGGSDSATVKIDVIAPTAGLPPELPSGSAAQWAAILSNPAIVIVHKADYLDVAEVWSTVGASEASPQTLAGGDLYAGGLGVSGQSAATSSIKQEIDGREALRFNLAEKANNLTLYLSQFFAYDDGTAFVESGRLRLLDDFGRVVKELGFHANSGTGLQTVSLASDVAFSAIELNAGVAQGSDFIFGGYANPDGSFGSNVFSDESGARHGSEFLVEKIVLGLPLGDAFSS
ncbi:cadherin-like domain-containing protein, partial [Accumulibacter sp.]|uniref:cadherin-like domain-containing protein n=1 Tax=Accumulibacter sp. TaxID=2053492 RepID=UPI002C0A60C6